MSGLDAVYVHGKQAWRYAQERGGQQLHLVELYGSGAVAYKALCGRWPKRMGRWRMTINVPLGHECKHCRKKLESSVEDSEP